MIEEMSVVLRKQTPTPPNEWVYEEYEEYGKVVRNFKPFVYLGKNAEPWAECTESDRLAYEEEWAAQHPEAETTEEVVEPNGDMPAESGTPDSGEVATQSPDTAEEGVGV